MGPTSSGPRVISHPPKCNFVWMIHTNSLPMLNCDNTSQLRNKLRCTLEKRKECRKETQCKNVLLNIKTLGAKDILSNIKSKHTSLLWFPVVYLNFWQLRAVLTKCNSWHSIWLQIYKLKDNTVYLGKIWGYKSCNKELVCRTSGIQLYTKQHLSVAIKRNIWANIE